MLYKPEQDEIEYIQNLKKRSKNTANRSLVKATSMVCACTMPEQVEQEMSKRYGRDWYQKPELLSKFMRQNPQYTVAKPL